MKGDSLALPMTLLKLGVGALFLLGLVLLFEGPTKIVSHDYTQPSYVHHHHHLCHVLTMSLTALAWWWVVLLILLARNRDAMQFRWAQRLFGLPVVLLSIVGAITGYYVYTTLESHDEVTYAGVMGVANGCLLLVLALMCFSLIQNPLREERHYAWNYLVVSFLFQAGLFCLFYFNNLTAGAVLSGVSTLFFAVGLYRAKLVLVREKIV